MLGDRDAGATAVQKTRQRRLAHLALTACHRGVVSLMVVNGGEVMVRWRRIGGNG